VTVEFETVNIAQIARFTDAQEMLQPWVGVIRSVVMCRSCHQIGDHQLFLQACKQALARCTEVLQPNEQRLLAGFEAQQRFSAE